jgi:hypothetical protein
MLARAFSSSPLLAIGFGGLVFSIASCGSTPGEAPGETTEHADAAETRDAPSDTLTDSPAADARMNDEKAATPSESDATLDGPFVADDAGSDATLADGEADGAAETTAADADAAVDAGMTAEVVEAGAPLADEVGFIDVPPQNTAAQYPGRMFYVFEAADTDAAHKPLAVFFNGGPGFATSLGLLAYGTARYTLDDTQPAAPPTANPASWTSFANLLYIDERQVGFSYGLVPAPDAGTAPANALDGGLVDGEGSGAGTADGAASGGVGDAGAGGFVPPACEFTAVEDAADFVRTLIRFLDAHPAIQGAPVMLVGESYGGTRATYMLDLLLRYSTEASRADDALAGEIQAHYDAVFPGQAGSVISTALAKTQFGRAILIQPLVLGGLQITEQQPLLAADPYIGQVLSSEDSYDVRQPAGWSDSLDSNAAAAIANGSSAPLILTEEPSAIPRFGPAARGDAFRVIPTDPEEGMLAADLALTSTVGALGPSDVYLMEPSSACPEPASNADPHSIFYSAGSGNEFLANLFDGVETFITNSRYDSVIYSPAIPALLAAHSFTITMDADAGADSGTERPGGFSVASPLADGGFGNAHVRFPPYTDSGHMVAVSQSQDLHDDVVAWMASTP